MNYGISQTGKQAESGDIPADILQRLAEQDFEIYSLREMMNRLQEGIYITDARGITLYVNTAFVHLSGLSREDLIGKRVHDMRDNGILPNSCCARVIETREPVTTINNYYQGQKCLVSGSPVFDREGNLIRTVAIVRDVSELDAMVESLSRDDRGWMAAAPRYADNLPPVARIRKTRKYTLPRSDDPLMQEICDKAARMADLDSTLLIVGETGTGKDYLASAIHELRDNRKKGDLIRINCGAIPEHLIESELFGYEKGAFTGANPEGRKGLLEAAGEGTVFLDEIGEMPYLLQVKLLNVLNDRQFYRVGGSRMIDFKARVIATTNTNLGELVKEKRFRGDLYFRLNVLRIRIPPLRRRQVDIPGLLNEFLNIYNSTYRKKLSFSTDALNVLRDYPWPGNVRELKSFVEKAVLFSGEEEMSTDEILAILTSDSDVSAMLPGVGGGTAAVSGTGDQGEPDRNLSLTGWDGGSLSDAMEHYEKRILSRAITSSRTLGDAAESLDIDLSTLMRKKRKYGLERR